MTEDEMRIMEMLTSAVETATPVITSLQEEVADLRRQLDRMREERDEALSGEADAVRRAEAAELGCELAYRREPTQAEGDAHEYAHHESMGPSYGTGECFVPMGGWTGRRCRVCRRWAWGGPTACDACAAFEAGKERADAAERERDEAVKQQRLAWERHAEKDRAYGEALKERDEARAELARLRNFHERIVDLLGMRREDGSLYSDDDVVAAVVELRDAEPCAQVEAFELRAELARLRARMPSEAELRALKSGTDRNPDDKNRDIARAWLARQEDSSMADTKSEREWDSLHDEDGNYDGP